MTTAVETNRYQLPTDDGEINQAFVELDDKLAQWTAAMLDAQAAMSRYSNTAVLEEPEIEETTFEDTAEEIACEEAQAEIAEEPVIESPAPVKTIEYELNKTEPISQSQEEPQTCVTPEERLKTAAKNTPAFGEKARASDDVKSEAVSEDDEMLLASLDPETSKAIRIMRRLNPGKKSVKELLAEYRAAPPSTPVEQPKKKSWWR